MFNPFKLLPEEEDKKASTARYMYSHLMYQPKPLSDSQTALKNAIVNKLTTSYKFEKQGCLPLGKTVSLQTISDILVEKGEPNSQLNRVQIAWAKGNVFKCCKRLILVIQTSHFLGSDDIYNILTDINRTTSLSISLTWVNQYSVRHRDKQYETIKELNDS